MGDGVTALLPSNLHQFLGDDRASKGGAKEVLRAVLDYLSATQFSTVRHVLRVTPLRARDRMSLDAAAQRNLRGPGGGAP